MNGQGKNNNDSGAFSAQRVRSKKIILICIMALIAFVICYFVTMSIVNYLSNDEAPPKKPIFFYMADWDKDIMEDSAYLSKDRNIWYKDSRSGIAITLNSDTLDGVSQDYKKGVALLCEYIDLAIKGDHKGINKFFSEAYYANGYKAKEEFTMQQIYDICITTIRLSATEENGKEYQSYEFWVEYKIRENNGTFRNDVGSDGAKPEMFIITDRNGDVKIDAIIPYSTK